jgi:hypothetical protein
VALRVVEDQDEELGVGVVIEHRHGDPHRRRATHRDAVERAGAQPLGQLGIERDVHAGDDLGRDQRAPRIRDVHGRRLRSTDRAAVRLGHATGISLRRSRLKRSVS